MADKDKWNPWDTTDNGGGISLWGTDTSGNTKKDGIVTQKDGTVIVRGFGDPIQFNSASDIKYFFEQLNYKNDPAFLKWAGQFSSIKQAQKVWNAAADYTYKLMKGGDVIDFKKVMNSAKFKSYYNANSSGKSSSGPATQAYISVTDKRDARILLRDAMMQMLNREPTKEEIADFTKQLNANERKFYRSTLYTDSAQITTGSQFDVQRFLNQYVLGKVSFKKDLEGQSGFIQDTVTQFVNENGLNGYVSDKVMRGWMRDLASGKITQDGLMAQIRDITVKVYQPFADMLKQDPTKSLSDVAAPYLQTYANVLELPSVNVKDALAKAIKTDANGNSTVMSVFEFEKSLRQDDRFKYTKQAANEAGDLASSFARAFGVNV